MLRPGAAETTHPPGPTGEQGFAVLQLMRHRGKGGQRGGSEPTLDPDRVQARPGGHAAIMPPDRVSRPHRNPVIAHSGAPAYFGAVAESRVERSRSSRAR